MKAQINNLGKVSITVEKDYWSIDKAYDKLTVVEKEGDFGTYLSRKPVPAGTQLTNREYWIPFSSLKEDIVIAFNSLLAEVEDLAELVEKAAKGVTFAQAFGDDEEVGISQKTLTESRDNIQGQIDSITENKSTTSKNIYDYNTVGVEEGLITTAGHISQNLNGFYTGFIPVKPNHYYYISNRPNNVAPSVRCFTSDKQTYMKVLAPSNGQEYSKYQLPNTDGTNYVANGQFKTPANAAYIQINLTPVNTETLGDYYKLMLEDVGDTYNPSFTPSEYEPYDKPKKCVKDSALEYPVLPLTTRVEALEHGAKSDLKILCFGSSFTQDSMSYVPFLLKSVAPNINLTLAIAYIGGSPLVQHTSYITKESFTSDNIRYYVENGVYKKQNITTSEITSYDGYTLFKSVNGEPWTSQSDVKVEEALAAEDWDIVTYQGSANQSHKSWNDYYAPYIYKLHKAFYDNVGKNTKLGWVLIHSGYESSDEGFVTRFEDTALNAEKVMNLTASSVLFPYGAAVQNLRSIQAFRALGDGPYHNLLVDTAHIQEGIGCLAAAYSTVLTILKLVGQDYIDIIGEDTRPDEDWIDAKNIPGAGLGINGVIGITEANCYLAQLAAIQAVKNPYEITDLNNNVVSTDYAHFEPIGPIEGGGELST